MSSPRMLAVPETKRVPVTDSGVPTSLRNVARAKLGDFGPYWEGYLYAGVCRGFSRWTARPGFAARKQTSTPGEGADAGGGRQLGEAVGEAGERLRPAHAEVAVDLHALRVRAGDAADEVPHADQVGVAVLPGELQGVRVQFAHRTPVHRLWAEPYRVEEVLAVLGEDGVAGDAGPYRESGPPDLLYGTHVLVGHVGGQERSGVVQGGLGSGVRETDPPQDAAGRGRRPLRRDGRDGGDGNQVGPEAL